MLCAHSLIYGRAEPHLITPIAHLGYFGKVQKAPYDPQQRRAGDPRDRRASCRATRPATWTPFAPTPTSLYAQLMERRAVGEALLPRQDAGVRARAAVPRPKLYPHAKYVVLTRHPLAVLSSYVGVVLRRRLPRRARVTTRSCSATCPALARLVRDAPVPHVWVKYEELVREPETHFRRVCDYLGVPFEEQRDQLRRERRGVQGPRRSHRRAAPHAPGDVVGQQVGGGDRVATRRRSRSCRSVLDELDPADLETLGYPRDRIVAQLGRRRARRCR